MRKLRNIRLRSGLTQANLSAITGVAEYTISEIEAGKRPNARPSTLRKLAQGLGVEVADLYGAAEHPLGEAPSPLQPPLEGFVEVDRRAATEWLRGQGFVIATMTLEELQKRTARPYNRPKLVELSQRAAKEAQRLIRLYNAGDLPRDVGFAIELTQERQFIFDLSLQVCDAAAQSRSETG